MADEVYRYVLSHLLVLSDEQLKKLNFDACLQFIDNEPAIKESKKIIELLLSIQRKLPLYHHGVLGQRWGVRHFQNKDGTLTQEGKNRYTDNNANSQILTKGTKFEMSTRNGEIIKAKPMPAPSVGKKLLKFLFEDLMYMDDSAGYRGDANYLLTDSKNRKIGELSVICKDSNSVYLDWIKVERNKRGKGYGTDIINNLITKARNSGYSTIEADVMEESIPFFEKSGFAYTDSSKLNTVNRIVNKQLGVNRMEYNLNELNHHGILGQKWGIRRYQNEDGTLTAAGKARQEREEITKAANQKKADVRKRGTFTTKELRKRIEKIQLEKQLRELTNEELYPGRKAVYQALSNIGTKVATTAISGGLLYGISAAVSGKFDIKELGSSLYYGGPKKK